MIKVLLVDDQRLMVDGLKTILDLEEDIEVVDIASNGEEALKKVETNNIDIILMDVRMPRINGVESTKLIKDKFPNIKILILTTFDEDKYIIDALAYGADGYMLKDIEADELIRAIRETYNNKYILPSNIAKKLAANISKKSNEKVKNINSLTQREREIAKMISQGFNNKQIASSLFLSEGTVKNLVSSIYSKINISDRAKAALYLKDILN